MSTLWKWLFALSLTLLLALFPFTLAVWAFASAAAALTAGIMGYQGEDGINYESLTYGEFMQNFVGSPIFHVGIALLAVFIISIVMLVKGKKN